MKFRLEVQLSKGKKISTYMMLTSDQITGIALGDEASLVSAAMSLSASATSS